MTDGPAHCAISSVLRTVFSWQKANFHKAGDVQHSMHGQDVNLTDSLSTSLQDMPVRFEQERAACKADGDQTLQICCQDGDYLAMRPSTSRDLVPDHD